MAVPPDASELDEGVLVVHDREGEEGEAMAVPAHVESSQQLLGDLLDAMPRWCSTAQEASRAN